MEIDRIIGRYVGEDPGPLLICTAALHGNEMAGYHALKEVFRLLDVEKERNPGFRLRGEMVGLAGNLQAISKGIRYIEQDMNRMWTADQMDMIRKTPRHLLRNERLELRDLIETIDQVVEDHPVSNVVIMDIHTTTAEGGIFCIATEDPESIRIASELHAPVILGMLSGIQGTTMHYFKPSNFNREITSFVFEAGQHFDPLSVNRSISAIIACLRGLGMVNLHDVETKHDEILITYSERLPKVAELIQAYQISDEESFQILPGFKNFDKVEKGQVIAYERGHPLKAIEDSLILMPRYQPLGDDGYFLLRVLID
jgi:succinylglutamate desuccinylase